MSDGGQIADTTADPRKQLEMPGMYKHVLTKSFLDRNNRLVRSPQAVSGIIGSEDGTWRTVILWPFPLDQLGRAEEKADRGGATKEWGVQTSRLKKDN